MQPVTRSIAVDSYTPPSINATYKRANGEAPFTRHRTETALPALLRPQLIALSDDDLRNVERRMYYQDREARRNSRIAERVELAAAQAKSTAEQREARLRQRAALRAKIDGEMCVKRIQEEYRTVGMR